MITLLCGKGGVSEELRLAKIVDFLGGTCRQLSIGELCGPESLPQAICSRAQCLLVSAGTLVELSAASQKHIDWLTLFAQCAKSVLVYGFGPSEWHGQLASELSQGALVGVESLQAPGLRFDVADDSICQQLSGLSFGAIGSQQHHVFVEAGAGRDCRPLLTLGAKPLFVQVDSPDVRIVLLAGGEMADLETVVSRGQSALEFFGTLAPVLIFLRASLNGTLWHNESPRACFIVDDPLLRPRYGFLDYQRLLTLMKAERFSTSIAFIPWNFNRSHRQAAELFAHHRGNYSLCVHGCDHTSGEFGSTDFTFLREKAQQALNRMKSHQGLSGVDFSRVMVFPQGIFSKAALQALKACNYLAAVNSTPYPVDEVDALTLKDLLQVTITRYGDFPLFTRRYPIEEAEQAFDLFLGKPALIVEHHSFFRNGYAALAETVRRLYKLDHRLRWADLDSICSQTCLKKVSERGEVHLLFFADRFCFQNDTNSRQSYVLIRRSRADQPARDVLINRQSVEFTEEKGWIRMTLILQPGQSAEARIDYEATNAAASTSSRRDPVYQVRVFLRRRLSEFRDNYLDKFRGLSRSARAVLRATQ